MAALPILPGLMASDETPDDGEGAPPPEAKSELTEFLNSLDDTQIQELVERSKEYMSEEPDGDEDGTADDGDETESTESEPPPASDDEEDAETETDGDEDETDEEPDMSGGLEQVQTQVGVDVEESAQVVQQLQELADGDSEFAPDIAKIAKQAAALDQKVQRCAKLVDKAIKKEDVKAAAQAGMDATDYVDAMKMLGEAAKKLTSKSVAPDMEPEDHPSLKMWAQKQSGRRSAG